MQQEFARWINVETQLSSFAKTIKHATPITCVKQFLAKLIILISAHKYLKELQQNHSTAITYAKVGTARDAQTTLIVAQVTSVTSQVTTLLSVIRNAQLHLDVLEKAFGRHVMLTIKEFQIP
jgi:hypothetical protein